MFGIVRALVERCKALLVSSAAVDLECDVLTHIAARKVELLRQAQRYDAEGLHDIATSLRGQAESLDVQRPLNSVLPAVEHLRLNDETPTLRLTALPPEPGPAAGNGKKGRLARIYQKGE